MMKIRKAAARKEFGHTKGYFWASIEVGKLKIDCDNPLDMQSW